MRHSSELAQRWPAFAVLLLTIMAPGADLLAQVTETDSFDVSITIDDSCTISTTDLIFSSQTDLSSAVDADSTVTVNCSSTTAYAVGLDTGGNGNRLMSDGSETIDYELYTTALRDTVWGDTVGERTEIRFLPVAHSADPRESLWADFDTEWLAMASGGIPGDFGTRSCRLGTLERAIA